MGGSWALLPALVLLVTAVTANYPVFLPTHSMQHLLLPGNTRVGSVIYRLKAADSDRDYPLTFAATDYGSYVIRVDALPCSPAGGCSANVVLERSVAPGQRYTFRLTVRDTTGDTTTAAATVQVTDGVADQQAVFPHVPGVVMVPEDTKVGTELEYIIVRKNLRSSRPASLELWRESNGSSLQPAAPEFRLEQQRAGSKAHDTTTGLIRLGRPLDYEQQTMFRLAVYALDAYTAEGEDSRNVAGFQLVVVVADVQDTAPVFDRIPPLTLLTRNLTQGDLVLRVAAHDGDTGAPRQITYGLVSENNPFTIFFTIGRDNGELRLARPLRELAAISRPDQPLLLTVVAEEVGDEATGPRQATEATVALLLAQPDNSPPYFQSSHYATMLAENSAQGTMLVFDESYNTEVKDDDMGKRGVFALSLANNNGTFEVSPGVAERTARFVLRVRDASMLDYEARHVLTFMMVATEVSGGQSGRPAPSSTVNVTVYLMDVNDQPPVFAQSHYTATMPENVTAGYHVLSVEARDNDTGAGGLVRYTRITGAHNASLSLHLHSGAITIATSAHGFDRELAAEYRLSVEARDEDGAGLGAEAAITITVTDVNDNAPQFVRDPFDFVLNTDGLAFADRAFVKAVDADAEAPNNVVRYEIVSGNYGDRFSLQGETGELRVVRAAGRPVRQTTPSAVTVLTVRAYDLGVPTQWTMGVVRVFPHSSGARVLTFIVPGRPSRAEAERLIEGAVGGRATVQQVAPYHERGPDPPAPARDLTAGSATTDKSVVVATVVYPPPPDQSSVDFDKLQQTQWALNNRTGLTASTIGGYSEVGAQSRALFWLLLLALLLIAAALISLLACCLCPCCPLFATARKRSHVHSSETVQFVKEEEHNQESKATQAEWSGRTQRREAWSGGGVGVQEGGRALRGGRVVLLAAGTAPQPNGLSVIYTRALAGGGGGHRPVLLEDLDANEYRVLRRFPRDTSSGGGYVVQVVDPARLARPEHDEADSLLRHERERGSVNEHHQRQHMFIRDGGAEILRLVTRNGHRAEEPMLNQPETRPYTEVVEGVGAEGEGKEIIMQRFMDDQKTATVAEAEAEAQMQADDDKRPPNVEEEKEETGDLVQRLHLSTGEVRSMRELLLTRLLAESLRVPEDTQSLPGATTGGGTAAMATQTDHDRGTQTDGLWRRRAKSDLDDSDSEHDVCQHAQQCRTGRRKTRSLSRCEIRTPILEEGDVAGQSGFAATKSSMLRQQVTRKRLRGVGGRRRAGRICLSEQNVAAGYVHDVVKDIERRSGSRSLETTPTGVRRRVTMRPETSLEGEEDSEEDFEGSVYDRARSSMSVTRNACTSPIQTFIKTGALTPADRRVSQSPEKGAAGRVESPEKSTSKGTATSSESRKTPRQSRYMEWYKTKREERERKKSEEKEVEKQKVMRPVKTSGTKVGTTTPKPGPEKISTRKAPDLKSAHAPVLKKQTAVKDNVVTAFQVVNKNSIGGGGGDKEAAVGSKLIEELKEEMRQRGKVGGWGDEDRDSGIAMHQRPMKHQSLMEKKSVFTIAYDDMMTRRLRLDSASPPDHHHHYHHHHPS